MPCLLCFYLTSLQCPITSFRPIQAVQSTWFGPAWTEVGWVAVLMPALVSNSVWATKSFTSGVSDAYIESGANRQILSVTCLSACATDYNLRADLVDFFIGTHRTTPVGRVWSEWFSANHARDYTLIVVCIWMCSEVSIEACMFKETELFCEADLLGMQFSIEGVSVFIHFIRVDHEGDESMCPK